jgi:phosphatidylglycerol---prolipoprotein diacylglyceryl transferase
MHQVLFDIGGFKIYSYGALLALSFFLANQFALYLARRFGYSQNSVEETVLYSILLGVAGSRLGYVIQYPAQYLQNPLQIFNLREGGLTVMGGVLFTIGVIWFRMARRKVSVLNMYDFLAGPLLVGMAFGRLGCFAHGCCHGKLCSPNLPWAVTFPPGAIHNALGGPRHPAQLYEMGLDLLLLAFITYQLPRLRFAGQNFYTFMLGYGVIRFLTEFSKENDIYWNGLSIYQWVCMGMIVLGAAGFAGLFGRPEVNRNIFPREDSAIEAPAAGSGVPAS